jgi:hypothetical protein
MCAKCRESPVPPDLAFVKIEQGTIIIDSADLDIHLELTDQIGGRLTDDAPIMMFDLAARNDHLEVRISREEDRPIEIAAYHSEAPTSEQGFGDRFIRRADRDEQRRAVRDFLGDQAWDPAFFFPAEYLSRGPLANDMNLFDTAAGKQP